MSDNTLVMVVTAAISLVVFAPLIYFSRQFERRQLITLQAEGQRVRQDADQLQIEVPSNKVESLAIQPVGDHRVHVPVALYRHMDKTVQAGMPSPLHVFTNDDLDFNVPDEGDGVHILVRAESQLAQIVEPGQERLMPVQPTTPVATTAPFVPSPTAPRRRREYQFCIGTDQSGANVFFPLGHMFIARRTRAGKSNIAGIVIGQALEQHIEVWYMSVGYAPVDEDGLDISPLVDRCACVAIEPRLHGVDCLFMLRSVVALIDDRKELAIKEKVAYFNPVLVVGEELKALQAALGLLKRVLGYENAVEECGLLMEYILSAGAKYNVNYLAISQDAQSQTVKLSQGTLDNIEIRIAHPSLDPASRRNVLPRDYDLKHHPLPKPKSPHQWYLIMDAGGGMPSITMVDVPKLDNTAVQRYIHGMPLAVREKPPEQPPVPPTPPSAVSMRDVGMGVLGPAQQGGFPEAPVVSNRPVITPIPDDGMPGSSALLPTDYLRVRDMMEGDLTISQSEVARQLWGDANGRYNQRAKLVMEVVRPFVRSCTTQHDTTDSDQTPD